MAKRQSKNQRQIETPVFNDPSVNGYIAGMRAVIIAQRAEIEAYQKENEELRRWAKQLGEYLDYEWVGRYQKVDIIEAYDKLKAKELF